MQIAPTTYETSTTASVLDGPFPHLSTPHLLGVSDLTREDILTVFRMSIAMRDQLLRPRRRSHLLHGRTIVNLFAEDSTRTRSSFELAERRLGADVLNFTSGGSSFSKGETILDTVRNLEAMHVDAIVIRHRHALTPWFLAGRCRSTFINAGDGRHEHPTQALLDGATLFELWKPRSDDDPRSGFEGRRVTIVGDILHSRVARSNIEMLERLGAEVAVCGPPTLIPRGIEALGVRVFHDLERAIDFSDALNMLRVQLERQDRALFPSIAEYARLFGMNHRRLRTAGPELIVMHPGPINRGVELDNETADGLQSVILRQVENGVAVRMAVLAMLLGSNTSE